MSRRDKGNPLLEELQTVVHRGHIVANLADIVQRDTGGFAGFMGQKVRQRRLGSLNHGREYGFLADVQVQKQ